jgi:excisionase family DNA binding protein
MDFSKIIIDGYIQALKGLNINNALLVAHFKSKAKKAKRDEFFMYEDFFNGCKTIVSIWRGNIRNQLLSEQNDKNICIHMIRRGGYRDGKTGIIVTDPAETGKEIRRLEEERDGLSMDDFSIEINKATCEIIPADTSFFDRIGISVIQLRFNQLGMIESAIQQAATELITVQPPQPEKYLTRKQAAEMLDVDLSTLWRWNKRNYLCAVEVGGKRRYRMSDVNRILGNGYIA